MSKILRFIKKYVLEMLRDFSCIRCSILVGPESRIIGFEVMDTSTRSGNHESEDFSGSPNAKSKSY